MREPIPIAQTAGAVFGSVSLFVLIEALQIPIPERPAAVFVWAVISLVMNAAAYILARFCYDDETDGTELDEYALFLASARIFKPIAVVGFFAFLGLIGALACEVSPWLLGIYLGLSISIFIVFVTVGASLKLRQPEWALKIMRQRYGEWPREKGK